MKKARWKAGLPAGLPALHRRLEGAGTEQELYDIPLVRLQPIQLDCRNRADIQAIDMRGVDQLPLPSAVLRDRAADQSRSDLLEHLVLRALDYAHEWEHEFGIRQS